MSEWKRFEQDKPDNDRWVWLYDCVSTDKWVNKMCCIKTSRDQVAISEYFTHWQYAEVPNAPKEERKFHRCSIGNSSKYFCEEYYGHDGKIFLWLNIDGSYYQIDYCCVCGYSPNRTEKSHTSQPNNQEVFGFTKNDL